MLDHVSGHADRRPSRASNAFAPSDCDELAYATKAIYVGGSGGITRHPLHGAEDVVFVGLPSDAILDVRTSTILTTGTGATNLVWLA